MSTSERNPSSIRFRALLILILGALISTVLVVANSTAASAETPFTTRLSTQLVGDVQMTGNAVVTCPPDDAACIQALNDGSTNGNARNMVYVDIDNDNDTFNSSSAGITLPANATVEWAGLYWAGTTEGANPQPNPALQNQVWLDTPAPGTYTTVTGSVIGTSTLNDDSYAGFADVTSLVSTGGNGTYTVANVQTTSGPGSTGAWGSWSIVVAYSDPLGTYRHVQVWDGYQVAFFADLSFSVSGIQTPAVAPVQANLGVYAGDGEPDVGPDNLIFDGTTLTAPPMNPLDGFFNSTVSRFGTSIADRNPADNYTLVSDIDTVNADGVIDPATTMFDITINSNEGIWPVLLWTSVALDAEPDIQVVKGGPTTAMRGQTVSYTFDVSHTPSSDGTPVRLVTAIDDVVGAGTYVSGDDGDQVLQQNETWRFEASTTFDGSDTSPVTNTVTVAYTEGDGDTGSTTDDHTTTLIDPSSISGSVVDDGGDPISGVTLSLSGVDTDGAQITATTTTLADGSYTFGGLPPGTFTVSESQPSAYGDGGETAGSEGGDDTADDAVSGIVLTDGTAATGYDFDETTGSIAGAVTDDNGDPISGVTISLSGIDAYGQSVSLSTATASNGSYSFDGLVAGSYTVTETQPTGFGDGGETAGTSGGDDTGNDIITGITLDGGEDATGYNFDETQGSISGTVTDDNGDPISGVAITLTGTDANGAVNATTTTGNDGTYSFTDLLAGTYTVTETQPSAYGDGGETAGTAGGDDTTDDTITSITLTDGTAATGYNFDETTGSIAGTVTDDNGDPISGVTITLTGTDPDGAVTATTTNGNDGTYSFDNLLAGTYTVTETQPTGYGDGGETAGTAGGDDTADDTITGITLDGGEDATGYNFDELTPASISGEVTDDNGDPISGVTISLTGTDANGAVTATTTTGNDGTYSFDNLLAGTYTVTETQPSAYGDGGETSGTAGGDDTADDTITGIALDGGEDATGYNFDETTGSIAGTVTDNNGDPISGVTITLTGTDTDGAVNLTTTTGNDGTYGFDDLLAGTYTVTETQPTGYGDGGETAGTAGGDDTADDTITGIALDGGEDATGYNFDETTGSIAGSVTDDNGDPISGVTITLAGTDTNGAVTATTTTGNDGTYSFTDLLAGTYTVAETQPSAYGDGGETAGTAGGDDTGNDTITSITLTDGTAATGYNFDETTGSIAGTVTDNNGDPISGVTITLTGTDTDGAVNLTTTTGNDGTYSFDNLLAGTYTVTETQPSAYGDGGETAGTAGGDDTGDDTITGITLDGGEDATGYDFDETQSSIAGAVTDDNGDPIGGVTITLTGTDSNGAVNATTTTANDGTYSFDNLLAGTYTVTETQPTAYGDGGETAGTAGGDDTADDTITGITLTDGTAATGYNFDETTSSIAGTVTDGNGDPISGVTITLAGTDTDGAVNATTTTANDGTYSFDNLLAGTYTVTETQPTAYGDGGETAGTAGGDDTADDTITSITLTDGTAATGYNFDETTGSIAGTVTDGNGDPISGVTIALTGADANGAVNATTTTGNDGTYSFDNLLAGTYTVTETQPTGYGDGDETAGTAGGDDTGNDIITGITLDGGEDATGYNFDETQGSISGTVTDDNGDPIGGVAITLTGTDANGAVNATTKTANDGSYSFTDLLAGTYTVTETQPTGYGDGGETAGTAGGDDTTDNTITSITLTEGTAATGYNFDETTGSISGAVRDDAGNGIIGVTVTLTGSDADGAVDVTTTTGNDGTYNFDNLLAGTYTVTETQPTTHVDGDDRLGTSGGDDSNDDIFTSITLAAGVEAADYDFDELRPAAVSGTITDDGGAGIPNVVVTITGIDDRGDSVTLTTTTGSDGTYNFDGLRPGTYAVAETQPVAYGDGAEVAGTAGGDTADDVISDIVLLANQTATGYDFDETTGSISGAVVDDSGDPIRGVTITLTGTDSNGVVNATTTTGNDGTYNFDGLLAGTYTVAETQPPLYGDGEDTPGTAGGDDTTDDTISSITLEGGELATGYNFDETRGSINGAVVDQAGTGIAGVTIELTGADDDGNPLSLTTTTGSDGSYGFEGLLAGTYTVTETQPTDYFDGEETAGSAGGDESTNDVLATISLEAGVDATDYDFEEIVPSSLGGNVVDDLGNPISGVTVTLAGVDDLGNPVAATAITDADGGYLFDRLRPGTYTLTETQPTGYGDGADQPGDVGGDNSANETISAIVLPGGTVADNYIFTETTSSLSGSVYADADHDGVRDNDEAGLAGVTVTLSGVDDRGNVINVVTTTGADGSYLFDGLLSGDYTIVETQPVEFTDGAETVGSVGGQATANDEVSSIALDPGVDGTGYHFGEEAFVISGVVWVDADRDAVRDGDESTGIAAVTITLLDASGNTVAVAETDDDGSYSFPPVAAGTYTVVETQPVGLVSTTPDTREVVIDDTDVDDVDFGEHGMTIEGRVWDDDNGNGVDDAEAGVAGVTVTLIAADGTTIASTTTDPDGGYLFTDVPAGNYEVEFETPTGRYLTDSNIGDDATDSDPDTSTGRAPVIVTPGNDVADVDAGLPETRHDLAVTIDIEEEEVAVGDEVTFTLTVTNPGVSSVEGAIVTFTLPSGTTFVDGEGEDWSCSFGRQPGAALSAAGANDGGSRAGASAAVSTGGGFVACTHVGTVTPGETLPAITIVATVDTAGSFETTVSVATSDDVTEVTMSNNEDRVTVGATDGPPTGTLAFTGSSTRTMLIVAMLLIGGGGVLIGFSRRRQNAA